MPAGRPKAALREAARRHAQNEVTLIWRGRNVCPSHLGRIGVSIFASASYNALLFLRACI